MSTFANPLRGSLGVCLVAWGCAACAAPGFIPAPRFSPRTPAGDPQSAAAPANPQKVGDPATDIQGIAATGAPMRLSQYRGQVILLDVSTMWCFFCQQDAPALQYLFQTYGPKGVAVLTCLTEDSNGAPVTQAGLKQWVGTYHLTQAVMNDASGGRDGVAEHAYVAVTGGFPTLAIIDKTFTVRYLQGGLDLPQVTAELDALLAQ